MPHVEGRTTVESATEARAGKPGRPVLYVLLGSTVGVIALFGLVFVFFFR